MFALFLGYSLMMHVVRRRAAGIEDLGRMSLNMFLFAIAMYAMLDEDFHVWMGSMAIGLAVVYAAYGWLLLQRLSADPRQLLVAVAIALGLTAMAFPLQSSARMGERRLGGRGAGPWSGLDCGFARRRSASSASSSWSWRPADRSLSIRRDQ